MANITLRKADQEALEKLVDRYSVTSVLSALETISYEKAEHLRSNWQDPWTAKRWLRAARSLAKWACADSVLEV